MMGNDFAYLAGGCFWGMEDLIRRQVGVIDTQVGYMGGAEAQATYSHVKTGQTGHAEAVRVSFDTTQTTYENILLFFFKAHDPTTTNQQGNDIGTQYRSEICYNSLEQKQIAEKVIERVNKSKAWGKPLVTKLTEFKGFWLAEDYHQDYLLKNPGGYSCHFVRKVEF